MAKLDNYELKFIWEALDNLPFGMGVDYNMKARAIQVKLEEMQDELLQME